MDNIICEKVFKTYYKIFPEDIELEPGETYESWISEMYEVDNYHHFPLRTWLKFCFADCVLTTNLVLHSGNIYT